MREKIWSCFFPFTQRQIDIYSDFRYQKGIVPQETELSREQIEDTRRNYLSAYREYSGDRFQALISLIPEHSVPLLKAVENPDLVDQAVLWREAEKSAFQEIRTLTIQILRQKLRELQTGNLPAHEINGWLNFVVDKLNSEPLSNPLTVAEVLGIEDGEKVE